MDTMQAFEMFEQILQHRNFYQSFGQSYPNYNNTLKYFDNLILELGETQTINKMRMLAKSREMTDDLLAKDLDQRRDFVKLNWLHEDDVENLQKVLVKYTSNTIPALDLFPGTGQFLPYVVACEPLYIVDRFPEIIDEAANILNNDFYKDRRIAKYTVQDFDVSNLPHDSFGLIYCFNEFFYADQGYVIGWAREVYKLLHNGGRFIFNFLPHDQDWAIRYNLNLNFSVIDYKDVINELQNLGFVIEDCTIQKARSSYIVAKKDGDESDRVKIGGSFAQIIYK